MKLFYKIMIVVYLLVALLHMASAFMDFGEPSEPAFWFFSGSLGMVGSVLLNYLHLSANSAPVRSAALLFNVILFIFSVLLAVFVTFPQTLVFAAISLGLLAASLLWKHPIQTISQYQ